MIMKTQSLRGTIRSLVGASLFGSCLLFGSCMLGSSAMAQESSAAVQPPATRQEMLRMLDSLKSRQARLPYKAPADAVEGGVVNNRALRELYLPDLFKSTDPPAGQSSATADPVVDYRFATQMFWIVSRANDCAYCLGHQEGKLKKVGVDEEGLLALDTDWMAFAEPQREAFALTRKLTLTPQLIGDGDIDALKRHFTDDQVLTILYLIGRYNATNRWTDATGIPQEGYRDFSSALSADALNRPSKVASAVAMPRRHAESFEAWEGRLADAKRRVARLKSTREVPAKAEPIGATKAEPIEATKAEPIEATKAEPIEATGAEPMEATHERLLAAIPQAGPTAVRQARDAMGKGKLDSRLKEKIAFLAAFEDEAWYMQSLVLGRLGAAGVTRKQAYDLAAGDLKSVAERADPVERAERAALRFVRKLTVDPVQVVDGDIESLGEHYSPYQIAEIIHVVATSAMLDRFTESVGLPAL
jgi:alkylhydroperoxidase family enzyme